MNPVSSSIGNSNEGYKNVPSNNNFCENTAPKADADNLSSHDNKCILANSRPSSTPSLTTVAVIEQSSSDMLTENICAIKTSMEANERSDTESQQDKYRFKYNFKKIILKTFEKMKQRNEQSLTTEEQKNANSLTNFKMSAHEIHLIEKIEKSYAEAIQLVRAMGTPSDCKDINTTINLTELAVRRIINFFKIFINFN